VFLPTLGGKFSTPNLKNNIMEKLMIIGCVFLILSWFTPFLIKDKSKRNIVGVVSSAVATGIFIFISLVLLK
jgi:hypothetical protein